MISVALEMRNPVKVPVESSLQAKKARKLNGVTDLSLQSRTPRTRSSILRTVLGSNMNLAPSTCKHKKGYSIMYITNDKAEST